MTPDARTLYVGKTKDVLRLPGSPYLGIRFKDSILGRRGVPDSGGNEIVGQQPGKGRLACAVACAVFEHLRRAGVPTHFLERLSEDSMLVRQTDPIRVEFISRNLACGSYLRRHPAVKPLSDIAGTRELTLKDDARDDPPLTEDEAVAQGLLTGEELASALVQLVQLTSVLTDFFQSKKLRLGDFKMEVGRPRPSNHAPKQMVVPALLVIDDLGYDNIRVFSATRLLGVEDLHAAVTG